MTSEYRLHKNEKIFCQYDRLLNTEDIDISYRDHKLFLWASVTEIWINFPSSYSYQDSLIVKSIKTSLF